VDSGATTTAGFKPGVITCVVPLPLTVPAGLLSGLKRPLVDTISLLPLPVGVGALFTLPVGELGALELGELSALPVELLDPLAPKK